MKIIKVILNSGVDLVLFIHYLLCLFREIVGHLGDGIHRVTYAIPCILW
jgi:hypothetical protein